MSARLRFQDPAGKHLSQQQINDLFAFVGAAMDLYENPKGRSGLLFDAGSPASEPEIVSVGRQFDDALAKLMGHFGVTVRTPENVKPKRSRRSAGRG
jgi:hypothetical protein